MLERITAQQQILIIEKLYYSTDSITSLRKYNSLHGEKIGKIGIKTIYLSKFYKMMKLAGFLPPRIRKIIEEITGIKIQTY